AGPLVSGTLGVTWRQDGAVYLNGKAVPNYIAPQPGQVPPAPWSGLSAALVGSWFSALAGFVGTIHYALIWNRPLGTAEILATHVAVANELAARGLTLTYGKFLANTLIATDGDSISRGYGASNGIGHGERAVGSLAGSYNFLNV